MADVKWIKIVTDIFDDEKMLLIESMPEADGIIVVWFKLLCMAGKQNNSGVFMLNDKIAYTDEMLATVFRRPLNTVRLALKTFEAYGMIEIVDNVVTIPNWEKHQSLDELERKKERNRKRVAAYREKQKLLATGEQECNAYSNVTDITCNAIERDKEREEDKERENIYCAVIEHLNSEAGTNYRASAQSTKRHINARLAEGFTTEDFKTVINKKCSEWKGTDMEKYLRPETLFGTKFESYLNAKSTKRGVTGATIDESKNDLDDLF